jgi:hypothetical protein
MVDVFDDLDSLSDLPPELLEKCIEDLSLVVCNLISNAFLLNSNLIATNINFTTTTNMQKPPLNQTYIYLFAYNRLITI